MFLTYGVAVTILKSRGVLVAIIMINPKGSILRPLAVYSLFLMREKKSTGGKFREGLTVESHLGICNIFVYGKGKVGCTAHRRLESQL